MCIIAAILSALFVIGVIILVWVSAEIWILFEEDEVDDEGWDNDIT